MDKHKNLLLERCRICGCSVLNDNRKCPAIDLKVEIETTWSINVSLDSPNVHPKFLCIKCRLISLKAKQEFGMKRRYNTAVVPIEWKPHTTFEDCETCQIPAKRRKPGRPTKMKTTKSSNNEYMEESGPSETAKSETWSSTDTASSDEQENFQTLFYTIDMQDLRDSIARISAEDRVLILLEIIKGEMKSMKEDILSISKVYKQPLALKSLDPRSWFLQRNKVIQAIVNGLCVQSAASPFQKCIVLEHLYFITGLTNLVAPFSFLTNIVILANTNSKIAANLFAKSLPGGTYTTLKSWMKNLTNKPLTFPSGSCVVAIDNDQVIPKKWKVRVKQKSRVSVVTSVCQGEVDSDGVIQRRTDLAPRNWTVTMAGCHESEDFRKKTEDATFYSPESQAVIRCENKRVIQQCLELVVAEQFMNDNGILTDDIDGKVEEIRQKAENRVCPNCKTVMPKTKRKCINPECQVNLKAAEKELSGEDILGTALCEPIRQFNYRFKEDEVVITLESKTEEEYHISQVKVPQLLENKLEWDNVHTGHTKATKITVSDPVFENPATYEAVQTILRHVGNTAKISRYGHLGPDAREWISVTMDGLPYGLAATVIDNTFICKDCSSSGVSTASYFQKEWGRHVKDQHNATEPKKTLEFDWVVLRIGPLHIEMNMVKTFFKINWEVFISSLAQEMGFKTENALKYAKKAGNHHQAMEMLEILQRGCWMELVLPYVRQRMQENKPLSVNDYIYNWAPERKDVNYIYMFEQVWRYLGAIKVYHIGIRRNNTLYVRSGMSAFAPAFSINPFTSKYQLIELRDTCERELYPPELKAFVESTESVTTSGNPSKGEGMDAQLEEVNKASKTWEHGTMTAKDWLTVFRNHDSLNELRAQAFKWNGISDPKNEAELSPYRNDLADEIIAWRLKLRRERYLLQSHNCERGHVSLDNKSLCKDLKDMTSVATANRKLVYDQVFCGSKERKDLPLKRIFITEEERKKACEVANMKKDDIIKKIAIAIEASSDEVSKKVLKDKFEYAQKKKVKKSELIELHNEVFETLPDIELAHECDSEGE